MKPGVECFLLWSISMYVPKRQLVSSHVTTIAWKLSLFSPIRKTG